MRRSILISTFFLLVFTVSSYAVEQSKAQPQDKRLQQKVAVTAMGVPLGDLLRELTAKTGVKMTARKDAADDKLAVFVESISLADLQDAVKDVLHMRCTPTTTDPKTTGYEFWMDLKTKQSQDEYEKTYIGKLRKQITDSLQDLDLSDKEIEEKYKDNPIKMWQLQDHEQKGFLQIFAGLPSDRCEELWTNRTAQTIPAAEIAPETQHALLEAINKSEEDSSKINTEAGTDDTTEERYTPAKWTKMNSVKFEITPSPGSNNLSFACSIEGLRSYTLPASSDLLSWTKMTRYIDLNASVDDLPQMEDEFSKALKANPPNNDEEYRALLDKVYPGDKIKIEKNKDLMLYDRLEEIAKKGKLGIVAPYYTCKIDPWFMYIQEDEDGIAVEQLLKQILINTQSSIDKRDNLRVIMMNNWIAYRSQEIPERMLAGWRTKIEKQGRLELYDLFQIARLSRTQIESLNLYGINFYLGSEDDAPIAWVLSLDSAQFSKFLSKEDLTVQDLSDVQIAMLQKCIQAQTENEDSLEPSGSEKRTHNANLMDSRIRLDESECQVDDKPQYFYSIRVSSDSGWNDLSLFVSPDWSTCKIRKPRCEIKVLPEK